jgi:hypothetical protein
MFDDLDIIVLTTKHKKSFTVELLTTEKVPFQVYQNEDWDYPKEMELDSRGVPCEPKQLVAYRIFRGHQACCHLITKDFALILEDDAVPLPGWKETVQKSKIIMRQFDYEVFGLYGKALNWVDKKFDALGLKVLEVGINPMFQVRWVNGAVGYVITKEAGAKILEAPYRGLPFDIFLPETFRYAVLHDNCQAIAHSFRYGSHFHGVEGP